MSIKLFPPFHYVYVSVAKSFIITKVKIDINSWADMNRYKTQGFGENLIGYSQFGLKGHNGEDYAVELGNDIYSTHAGTITQVSQDDSLGWGVEVTNMVNNFKTRYWHMKKGSILVKVGEIVGINDKLGEVNNTGYSFGNHLHFDLQAD